LVAATDGATPFRLNLHQGDVGHTLVVGPTGAGKSVLLGLLAAQWRRYAGARVVILDTGRSCRALTLGLGGTFLDLMGDEGGVALQPLRRCDEPLERSWARDWLIGLFAQAGLATDTALKDEIWRALGVLADRPAPERTLSLLAGLLQDAALRQALEPFTCAGSYGALLDAENDPLLDQSILALEMGELTRSPEALNAVLPCLVRALERGFDGSPTLLILDEAWAYLRNSAFAAQIQAWLKTLRKRNVAVVFATQEIADVESSGLAATILEACPTRIFLANERAREPRTAAFYAGLGLNPRQIALIAEGVPKQDYYVQSRAGARRVNLDLGPAALAFLGASKPADHAAMDRLLAQSAAESFAVRWLDHKGQKEAARALRRFEGVCAPANDSDAPALPRHSQGA
jgi:type IV secretion system protein VirB4